MKKLQLLAVTATALILCACSSPRQNIYAWGTEGAYTESVYQSINQEGDPQEQIQQLQNIIQTAGNSKVPPGLYAQLGLLYGQTGDLGKMHEAYQKESQLYPESAQFINFLLNKGTKNAPVQSTKTNNAKGASK